MNKRHGVLLATFATATCLLLAGCTSSSNEPDQPSGGSSAETQSDGANPDPTTSGASATPEVSGTDVVASDSPTTVPAPGESDDVVGLEVEISSTDAQAGQPVEVTVTVPASLAKESVVLVSPAQDGTLSIVSSPVGPDKDRRAYFGFDLATTTTLRAVVADDDMSEAASLPADAKILGQSSDFTITVS